MKYLFRIIKILIVSTLTIFLVSVTASYLLLNIPSVQQKVTHLGEKELSKLLDTRLTIGKGHVFPFNKIQLSDVCLYDRQGDTLLYAQKLIAGFAWRNYCKNDWFSRLYNFMISKFLFKKRIRFPAQPAIYHRSLQEERTIGHRSAFPSQYDTRPSGKNKL